MCVLRLCSTVTLSCSWDRFKRVEKSWCCRSYSTASTWSLGGSSKIAPKKLFQELWTYRQPVVATFCRIANPLIDDLESLCLTFLRRIWTWSNKKVIVSTSCHHFRRRRQPIITRERIYQWKWISFTVGCYYFAFFCLWDVIKGFFFFVCSSYPQL